MRVIDSARIRKAVSGLCMRANFELRPDVLTALKKAYLAEKLPRAKRIIHAIIDNAAVAARQKIAICQDTGFACVFIEIGQDVRVKGDLYKAVMSGVEDGYRKGYLRDSIVDDPLDRRASGYAPTVVHYDIVKGSRIRITVLPKGFGCENKSQLKMFNPTAGIDQIKSFVVSAVRSAGPDACPPYVVGVGIGGTADHAGLLAKKALLRKIGSTAAHLNVQYKRLEQGLLKDINALRIGPMGLGGKTTALAVHVQAHPTHIAGLPVAVNISCHATRSASVTI